jgi:hypothetical protein
MLDRGNELAIEDWLIDQRLDTVAPKLVRRGTEE